MCFCFHTDFNFYIIAYRQYKFTPPPEGRGRKFNDGFTVKNQLSPHQRWGLNYILDGTMRSRKTRCGDRTHAPLGRCPRGEIPPVCSTREGPFAPKANVLPSADRPRPELRTRIQCDHVRPAVGIEPTTLCSEGKYTTTVLNGQGPRPENQMRARPATRKPRNQSRAPDPRDSPPRILGTGGEGLSRMRP